MPLHSKPNFFSPNQTSYISPLTYPSYQFTNPNFPAISHSAPIFFSLTSPKIKLRTRTMTFISTLSHRNEVGEFALEDSEDLDHFATVANELADAAGDVIRKYFRKNFDIHDKEDLSPVTVADQAAEEAMVRIILENFPSHAMCQDKVADYVWVLDPIDGTKSFITGKPLFGTLVALLYKGKPVLGIIDQPILRERWLGLRGRKTTLNGQEISTRRRSCAKLSEAYMYTTSPHLFSGDATVAFTRVREKVKFPLYGCDCYAYALLATGFVDLVIESGLKLLKSSDFVSDRQDYQTLKILCYIKLRCWWNYITDWKGHKLSWKASANSQAERSTTNAIIYLQSGKDMAK